MTSQEKKYYLGLDIGTNSVGWAVTNDKYEIPKFRGHKMWGSRLFNEAETAEARRIKRSNRRRLARRKYRLNLLEEIFTAEIAKVDRNFFRRLDESKYHYEDRSLKNDYILFDDIKTDEDYFEKYPTIYHLRTSLIKGERADIRELYLAIHNIVKYRGHFLRQGENINIKASIKSSLKEFFDQISSKLGMSQLEYNDKKLDAVEKIFLNKETSSSDKQKKIVSAFNSIYKKPLTELIKLSLGLVGDMSKVFIADKDYNLEPDINFKDLEKEYKKFKFNESYEENIGKLEEIYGDYFEIIEIAKNIYDSILLSKILVDGKGLSESKVISYKKHKEDLKILKELLKNHDKNNNLYGEKSIYYKVFREDKDKGANYVNYAGRSKNGKKISKEDFYSFLIKTLKNIEDSEQKDIILKQIEIEDYLPLQREKINNVIPYQLHLDELKKILEKASIDHPFLDEAENGISNKEKIISLMKFRIPYYIGPINDYHRASDGSGFSWVVKKSNERVLPWNFDDVIDREKSASAFIENMINNCTYISGERVLAKKSILYSEFSLLNELNNLKYDGVKISIEAKKYLLDIFKNDHKKMTKNRIKDSLKAGAFCDGKGVITGIDKDIKSDLDSYRDMKRILGDGFDLEMAENIIRWITLFNDEKLILKNKIQNEYGDIIDENQLKKIYKLKYKDWGSLSEKFLTEMLDDSLLGKTTNIITAMRETNNNLMVLLSDDYGYMKSIKSHNKEIEKDYKEVDYSMLDDMYISPSVKRSVWQSIRIVEEIKKIMGSEPNKIFIEMTRTNRADKKRTSSRRDRLIALYKNLNTANSKEILKDLKGRDDFELRKKKLYLYYTQMGKCMYSGNQIGLDDIFTSNYDIDHIYPRSKTKDDSFDNYVLVLSEMNKKKGDNYPIQDSNMRQESLWKQLETSGLISSKKYERLMRKTELSDQELSDFIARQLVETSQSTKAVGQLLGKINENSKICYVKAENVTDFRNGRARKKNKNDNPKPFIKFRDLNDLHHAKDAYLNIVVGNVYDEKFTKNPLNFIKEYHVDPKKKKYSLNYMYRFIVERNGYIAWNPDESMKTVEHMMRSNDVRVTNMSVPQSGAFYDETVYKAHKTKKDSYYPLKTKDKSIADVSKYGGFTSIKIAYYNICRYTLVNKDKEEKLTRLVPIPIYLANDEEKIKEYQENYINNSKKEIINVELLYKKLCINSKVKVDGFNYYICGKTDDRVVLRGAIQVIIPELYETYLKNISTYLSKKESYKDMDPNNYKIGKGTYINSDTLLEIYRILLDKKGTNLFMNKLNNNYEKFSDKNTIDKFEKLSLDEKCKILLETLNTLTDKNSAFNLKAIDISAYRARKNMNLSGCNEFKIINQSVTGLYEKQIKIL